MCVKISNFNPNWPGNELTHVPACTRTRDYHSQIIYEKYNYLVSESAVQYV